jgi:hypothetical protein
MLLPNGETLIHDRAPYNPQKAHEYYIRTRHLKGRRHGSGQDYSVVSKYGTVEKLTGQQLTEQRVYAAHRVTTIQNRLKDLGTKLQALVASQSKTKTPASKTAAGKATAAAKAKTYRQTHKQQISNKAKASTKKAATTTTKKAPVSTTTRINSLQDKIAVTKQDLLDAVAKQRRLAAAKKIG